MAELVGQHGDTPESVALLRGHLPSLPNSTLPETMRILQTLATDYPVAPGTAAISSEEFEATYAAASENTSSSPSGHHIGHYKAILDNPLLVQLHSSMMSIPFQAGFAPER